MQRNGMHWIVVAIVVIGLAALSVVFGLNLIPTREAAAERGSVAPWFIAWGMIAITVLSSVVLAGFLFANARKTSR